MSQLRTVKLRCFVRHDRLWCVKLSGVLNSSICTVCFTPPARFIPKRRDTDSDSIFETCAPPHYPMATCHPDRSGWISLRGEKMSLAMGGSSLKLFLRLRPYSPKRVS